MSGAPLEFCDLKRQYAALKDRIAARMQRVLDHGQYIMGPEVAELEAALAQRTGAAHCVTVASGTEALLIALMALDLKPGDEVVTTPFTFAATAETIVLLGGVPVFADIEPDTCNLDADLVEAKITPRTRAILPVGLYGQCADMDAIDAIAARHGLAVIEDAAQSFGATYKGRASGALSTLGCTSFFPSKPLGCYGDGGALFTNDAALAQAAREIRVHGQSARYTHTRVGVGGRMDTLQCAVVLAKLERFDWELAQRRALAARYDALLAGVPGVARPVVRPDRDSVWAQYTVQLDGRDAIAAALKAQGIPTAVHYPRALHHQPAYARFAASDGCPHALAAAARVLSLPMSADLAPDEQERVAAALAAALRGAMRAALGSVAIQAAGSAATFAAALWVASTLGFAAQGQFALLRSWGDAATTLAVLGVPQALLHLRYREHVEVAALRPWMWRYVIALFALVAALLALGAVLGPMLAADRTVLLPTLVVGAAVPFGAAHLLGRSLLLRDTGPLAYAAVTAAPALLVLMGVLIVGALRRPDALAWPLFGAALLAALFTAALVRRVPRGPRAAAPWSRRTLWSVSLETGGQNVLAAAAPALLLGTAGALGGPLAAIGAVSLGLHVYQLFGVAAAYVAPLAYDRAARAAQAHGLRELWARLRRRIDARVVVAAVAVAAGAVLAVGAVWPAGRSAWPMLAAMALAGALSMAVRLLVTLLLARGAFRALTLHALGRVLLGCGLTAALMPRWPATVAVPAALFATEAVLLAWALRLMRAPRAAPPEAA